MKSESKDEGTATRTTRLRHGVAALALGGALCVVLLGLFEVCLRAFAPQRGPTMSATDASGMRYILPDLETVQSGTEFRVDVRTDGQGRRLCPGAAGANTPPVILLGDSFGFGWGVPGEVGVGCRLQHLLGRPVVNLAVPGDGPAEQLARMSRLTHDDPLPEGASVLVLAFGGNDLDDLAREEDNLSADWVGGSEDTFRFRVPIPFKSWLRERSHAYTLLSRGWSQFLIASGVRSSTLPFSNAYLAQSQAIYEARQTALEEAYQAIAMSAAPSGQRPTVAYIPHALELDEDLRSQLSVAYEVESSAWAMDQPRDRIAQAAAGAGMAFLDLREPLAIRPPSELYYALDGHWREAGHALVAEFLSRQLR